MIPIDFTGKVALVTGVGDNESFAWFISKALAAAGAKVVLACHPRVVGIVESFLTRVTYVGAAFLAVIAIIPTVINTELQVDYRVASFYGGTGLLIVISVALDLVQKINSHLVMRNYPGLTED